MTRDYCPPTSPGYDPGSEPDPHRYDEPEPEDQPCPYCGRVHPYIRDDHARRLHKWSDAELSSKLAQLGEMTRKVAAELAERESRP